MTRFFLNDLGIVCALGADKAEVGAAMLMGDQSRMTSTDAFSPGAPCVVGVVDALLAPLTGDFAYLDCRNNRLLRAAADQIGAAVRRVIDRVGADRVGIVIGTSTSGIAEGERAIAHWRRHGHAHTGYDYRHQRLSSGSDFLARYFGVGGPAVTISTACSSSAHAFGAARRLMRLNLSDAVVVGGADTASALTVRGFRALDAVSRSVCNPMSVHRDGINIGEGACVMLLSRDDGGSTRELTSGTRGRESDIELLGVGASSDAHHISAPDPTGRGALRAMRDALADAGLEPAAIDYINLHGTGTPLNDAMESRAIAELFGTNVACSSTKPLTGHTLGAAGAIELGLCWLALANSNEARCPPHVWDGERDPELPDLPLVARGERNGRVDRCLSNSFAFGGNNAAVIIGRRA
jgi:3-oxoacyl-[acyl-carrier-protein] synthase-1